MPVCVAKDLLNYWTDVVLLYSEGFIGLREVYNYFLGRVPSTSKEITPIKINLLKKFLLKLKFKVGFSSIPFTQVPLEASKYL